MGAVDLLLPFVSTIFKLSVYIYLRVIPYTQGKLVIPSLYTIYTSLSIFGPKQLTYGASTQRSRSAGNTLFSSILAVVFSLPSSSTGLRSSSFLLNTTLLLLALDFTTYPLRYPAHDVTFIRVGAVDHKSAKLLVRYPQLGLNDTVLKVVFRPSRPDPKDEAWLDGPTIQLKENADWTNFTVLVDLWPNTTYEYMLAGADHGLGFLPYPPTPLSFKTFPDPRLITGTHFKFIATSCILPNFPYVPGMGDRIKGFDLLFDYIWPTDLNVQHVTAKEVAAEARPGTSSSSDTNDGFSSNDLLPVTDSPIEFLLTLGDFIYADVPAYFGDTLEAYQRLYRRMYASPSFRRVYERLPSIHIYDDHEIVNNFAGNSNDSSGPYNNASQAFRRYIADTNFDSPKQGSYYYDFRYGDVAYFVMDTRRDRTDVRDSLAEKRTMLGETQLNALLTWISEVNQTATFKFVVSSVPVTSLWQFDAQTDSWAAFTDEKQTILDALHTVPNVIILSGDRHEFAVIEYTSHLPWSHPVREISTSPLNMFYVPFVKTLANESKTQVTRNVERRERNDNGTETTFVDSITLPKERVLKHISHGNHKWSTIEVDSRNLSRPVLKLETMIDGHPAFRWNITGESVNMKKNTALGNFVPQSFQMVMDKMGFTPSKWF